MPEPKPLGEIAKDLLFELLPMDSDEKWEAVASAVVKANEERKANCKRCGGSGRITVRHGISYETDSPEERRLNVHQERCPECSHA